MAIKAAVGLGTAERFATSALRVIADVASAVGDGIRARNEVNARVGLGVDPATAAAAAMRNIDLH